MSKQSPGSFSTPDYKKALQERIMILRDTPPRVILDTHLIKSGCDTIIKRLKETPNEWIECSSHQARIHNYLLLQPHLDYLVPELVSITNWLDILHNPQKFYSIIISNLTRYLSMFKIHVSCSNKIINKELVSISELILPYLITPYIELLTDAELRKIMLVTDDIADFLDEELPKEAMRPSVEAVMNHFNWLIKSFDSKVVQLDDS